MNFYLCFHKKKIKGIVSIMIVYGGAIVAKNAFAILNYPRINSWTSMVSKGNFPKEENCVLYKAALY